MAENGIRALCFDTFGTLVDWRSSLLDALAPHLPPDSAGPVVDAWRAAYRPALDAARQQPVWRDLDALQRETLTTVLAAHDVSVSPDVHETLVQAWRRLRPWPDVRDGLERLRATHVTATLSNGHVALLVDLLRFGDLRVDVPLSAELAGSYKPDAAVYLRAAQLLGVAPGELAMVAAHADDLEAAAAVGLRPVFVHRPLEWGPAAPAPTPPDLPGLLVVDGLDQLADALSAGRAPA